MLEWNEKNHSGNNKSEIYNKISVHWCLVRGVNNFFTLRNSRDLIQVLMYLHVITLAPF